MVKRVLCYGDSNTWGFIPITEKRYGKHIRWPAVMGSLLGRTYEVLEEGFNGRTTVFYDPEAEGRNGLKSVAACIQKHKPVDHFVRCGQRRIVVFHRSISPRTLRVRGWANTLIAYPPEKAKN